MLNRGDGANLDKFTNRINTVGKLENQDLKRIMKELIYIFTLCCLGAALSSGPTHKVLETEMFAIPITPNMFNWTYQEFNQQYRFHAALVDKPELPAWLRYLYSGRHHSGFIFGTPPRGTKSPLIIEVVGLNRQDYETRRHQLTLVILEREKVAQHEVEMKIDNLNVEDLLNEHRMLQLKDVFRKKLWIESQGDLYATFLSSAIDMGARLPLKPSEGEGLVVRIGSAAPLSAELKRVREEVRPLSRLASCPREYKRTTVERLFRDAGFTLDWCNFELYNTTYTEHSTNRVEYLSEISEYKKNNKSMAAAVPDIWDAPEREHLPSRSYMKEITIAVLVPILLLLVAVGVLTAALCVHYAGMANKTLKVEQIRYENNSVENRPNTDSEVIPIDGSSQNGLNRPYSPKSKSTTNLAGSYNRPQPPPYLTSAGNTLQLRKPGNTDVATNPDDSFSTGNTKPKVNLALEQSIKLLNEAKISPHFSFAPVVTINEPDLDSAGTDYSVEPNMSGYLIQNDVDIEELKRQGFGGVASPGSVI